MRSNTRTQKITSLTIVRAGLFIALSLVLKILFEIYIPLAGLPALRINFASIPIMISGIVLGPFTGFLSGAAADIINFMIKPNGPFFPGFTLVSSLSGMIPGLIFKYTRKNMNFNILNTIFIAILSAGFVGVFIFKGVITFEGSMILYNGHPVNIFYIIGFLLLVAVYIILPIIISLPEKSFGMNKIVFTVSVTQLITSIILNTYFLSIVYGKGVLIFLPARIFTNFFMIPIYSIIIGSILKTTGKKLFSQTNNKL